MPPPRTRRDSTRVLQLPLALAALAALLAPAAANLRAPPNSRLPPEAWMTTPELISHWGYPGETHTVQTEDGFFLEVHRITAGRGQFDKPGGRKKAPVLLAHGYGATSECMVLREHDNLAFMLANADFDVWLGNTRGNFYGKRHAYLSKEDKKFWDFTWHENGVFDMRSTIDYVLNATGEPSVMVVGHSMGASSLFALLSERPEYNAKVRASFLLAPAVYFYNLRGTFAQTRRRLPWDTVRRTVSQLTIENPFTRAPYPALCLPPNGLNMNPNCMKVFADAQGPFHKMRNNTYLPILLRHWPGGTSINQLAHFIQLIIRGDGFRKFDYGPERNRALYGQSYPPAYNLKNVLAPTFFFYCDNDYQANYKDVKRLAADVPGTAGVFRTPSKVFNHLDIMYEEEAARLVYKRLIEHASKYRYSS